MKSRAPSRPSLRARLPGACFFVLVALAAAAYFGQNGMYRTILPYSAAYLSRVWQVVRASRYEAERFELSLTTPYDLPSDYGGGPMGEDQRGRYVAVTAPALRVTLPPMSNRGQYDVTVSLSAELTRPSTVTIQVGDRPGRDFTVRGDGSVEALACRVPASALSGTTHPIRVMPSWPPTAETQSPEGRQGVWFYLRGLTVQPVAGSQPRRASR